MRDFKREAPGRSTKSANKINAATAHRRLEENSFTRAPASNPRGASFYDLQRPFPAGLIEEMHYDLAEEQKPIAPTGL